MSEKLHVGQGHYDGAGVTVFPVWLESEPVKGFCWKSSHLTVGENVQGASVNNLTVTNNGHRPHIVLEGDIFEGGMQNRVLTRSYVLARGEQREVPVACVEEGRWHGTGLHQATRRRAPMGVQFGMINTFAAMNCADVQGSDAGTHVQGGVWNRIRQNQETRGFVDANSLMESMNQAVGMNAFERPMPSILPGQRGVIIGIGGYVASAEFFGNTDGLAARWEGIIEAARYEALEAPQHQTPSWAARDFAASIEGTPMGEDFKQPREFKTPTGPLALTSFAISLGLIHAAVFNGAHPLLAEV